MGKAIISSGLCLATLLGATPLAAQRYVSQRPAVDTLGQEARVIETESYRQLTIAFDEGRIDIGYCRSADGSVLSPAAMMAAGGPSYGILIFRTEKDSIGAATPIRVDSLPISALDAQEGDSLFGIVRDVLNTNNWLETFCANPSQRTSRE